MPKKKDSNGAGANGAPTRMELPLATLPQVHPCSGCGRCCTYVAVEIDNPSSFEEYDNIYWYLTHKGVSVYVDWESDWYIEFETVCEHLSDAKTCNIYEERPKICSDFSWDECEHSTQEPAWKFRFEKPQELLDFLEAKRPRNFERYMKEREKLLQKREKARQAPAPELSRPTPTERAESPA